MGVEAGGTVLVAGAGGFIGGHLVASLIADGRSVREQLRGSAKQPERLGRKLAAQLIAHGAGEILELD